MNSTFWGESANWKLTDHGSNQATTFSRCWKPMKIRLDLSNFNNYQQTTQEQRYDVAFQVKEVASRMSNPTAMSFHHLKKFLGYLKQAMDYCLSAWVSRGRKRLLYAKKGESYWCLETFSDSDKEDSTHWTVVDCSTVAEHRRSLAYLCVKQKYTR